MDDDPALELFSEMVESSKSATEDNPTAFFLIFSNLSSTLNVTSSLVDNSGLRLAFYEFQNLEKPLYTYHSYKLQNFLLDNIAIQEDYTTTEAVEEIIFDAVSDISVYVFSDGEGRNIIDTDALENQLEMEIESETHSIVFFNILETLKLAKGEFVDEASEDLISFYNDLIETSDEDWDSVNNVISGKLLEMDSQYNLWKR